MVLRITACIFLIFFGNKLWAQDTLVYKVDSAEAPPKKPREPLRLLSWKDPHSPKKATIYSAIIPGLGQAYNRKWIKVPVVYALMGGTTYAMLHYRSLVNRWNSKIQETYVTGYSGVPRETLIDERNLYRNYRDFAIVGMVAAYGLQILDATVDAHFYKLDIDQSLSLKASVNASQVLTMKFTF